MGGALAGDDHKRLWIYSCGRTPPPGSNNLIGR